MKGPPPKNATARRLKNNQVEPINLPPYNPELETILDRLDDMPLQDPREEGKKPDDEGMVNLSELNATIKTSVPKIIRKGKVVPITPEHMDQIAGKDYLDNPYEGHG